jgi:hypothetical protein
MPTAKVAIGFLRQLRRQNEWSHRSCLRALSGALSPKSLSGPQGMHPITDRHLLLGSLSTPGGHSTDLDTFPGTRRGTKTGHAGSCSGEAGNQHRAGVATYLSLRHSARWGSTVEPPWAFFRAVKMPTASRSDLGSAGSADNVEQAESSLTAVVFGPITM